jgi:hypothetical protein
MVTGLVVGLATLDTGLVGLATLEWPVGLATLGPREGGQVRSSESCRPHGSALPAPPVIWRHRFLTASDPTKCRPLHHHHAHPPMHFRSIQPHAAALNKLNYAATLRLPLVDEVVKDLAGAKVCACARLRTLVVICPMALPHKHWKAHAAACERRSTGVL